MDSPEPPVAGIDYRLAFERAPVGMVLSREREIVDCNQRLCEMFGATRDQLVGQSLRVLYPSAVEFERIGRRLVPILNASGRYADHRMMRRLGDLHGAFAGETFWCHVTGHALNRVVQEGLTNARKHAPGQPVTITIAALVTVPAVARMPVRTASSLLMPLSTASRTRLRISTW